MYIHMCAAESRRSNWLSGECETVAERDDLWFVTVQQNIPSQVAPRDGALAMFRQQRVRLREVLASEEAAMRAQSTRMRRL